MDNVIPIEVSPEAALAFSKLSPKDQSTIKRSMSQLIESSTKSPVSQLLKTMKEASEQAKKKGLTPDILSEILAEAKSARRP